MQTGRAFSTHFSETGKAIHKTRSSEARRSRDGVRVLIVNLSAESSSANPASSSPVALSLHDLIVEVDESRSSSAGDLQHVLGGPRNEALSFIGVAAGAQGGETRQASSSFPARAWPAS